MAAVTNAIVGLSYNYHSQSSLSLKGMGFTNGANGTVVTVHYPATGAFMYEWTERVHKVSADGTKAEVKVKQNQMLTAEQRKNEKDTTDTVRILVDGTQIDVMAELYTE